MSDDIEPSVNGTEAFKPISHSRILWIMAALGIVGGVAGMMFRSIGFGFGILIGTGLAFINYYWLKRSLRKIFDAASSGERPRMLAGKYFLRYVALAVVVAVIYATDLVPIIALILGLGSFAFAVVIEGLIRIGSR